MKRRCRDSDTESSWRRSLLYALGPISWRPRLLLRWMSPATLQRGCGTLDAESFGIPAMLACSSAKILAGQNASRWHESYLSPGMT